MLLTKKERKKERNRSKTTPRPPTGGGVISEKSETVELWAMSARMCMQSFVALHCVLRKPWGFLDAREQTIRTTTVE